MSMTLLNHPIVMSLGWTLIHSFWIALAITLLVRIAWLRIAPDQAVRRYRVALSAMLAIFLGAILVFGFYYEKYQAWYDLAATTVVADAEAIALYPSADTASETSMISIARLIRQLESWFPLLVLAWLLGTVLMSLRLTGSWWYLRRLEKHGVSIPDERWKLLFPELCTKMGIHRDVRLYWSDRILEPITLRHWKPIVLFPIGLVNQLSMEQVEVILLHELSHIKRWDYLVNWLQSMLELLFFFHPAVWWLSAQVRTAREHCCDDLVLQANRQQRMLYARTLTQVSAFSLNSKTNLAMSLNGNNNHEFTARIKRLFGQSEPDFDWRKPILTGFLTLFLLGFGLFFSPKLTANASTIPLQQEEAIVEKDNPPVAASVLSPIEPENPSQEVMALTDANKSPKVDSIPAKKAPEKESKIGLRSIDDSGNLSIDDPLIVLDGKIMGTDVKLLKEIEPDDIESINVLKGEAALEKYGEQAQNGVIEITLKKEIVKVSKWTNEMDVGDTFKETSFFFGPAGDTKQVDPLVVLDGKVMGRKSKVENQIDESSMGYITFSGPTEQLRATYGAEAADGVVTMTSKVETSEAEIVPVPGPKTKTLRQELTDGLQIFPNPTQDKVQINYQLNEELNTSLKVFDANGRLVAELASIAKRVGPQSATWDAANMPAGTYSVVLQAGEVWVSKSVVKQ